MNIRNFRTNDLGAAAGVFGRGPALLPRNSHVIDKAACAALGRELLKKASDDGTLHLEYIHVADEGGRIVGIVSALPPGDGDHSSIRWLAVEEGENAAAIAESLLRRSVEVLGAAYGGSVKASGWFDDSHQVLHASLEAVGLKHFPSDKFGILMGMPLPGKVEVPELPEGYSSHTYQPGDELRWVEAKNAIFETNAPSDQFEQLYSGRSTFEPDEVVFLEFGEELIGISAGVDHRVTIDGQEFGMAYLDWVGVKSEHRGKHLGDYVCLHCMDYLRRKGNDYCTLVTQSFRVPAVKLYRNLGFEIISETRQFELNG